ncbi:hypothetical protein RRG08_019497 [Elysia crispata]|uniref:Uncharacterized protein n=1 Tax=Elysia crispata TaxID=231223 RepID=A0AAE1CZ70_9GAST|nr:hypothetical protein RRG08_019497 [Elysia crispata]
MAAMRKDQYASFPEPDPDYQNDDDDDSSGTHGNQKHVHPQLGSPGWKVLPHMNGASASDAASCDFPPPPPPLTAEELAAAVSEGHEAQAHNGMTSSASDGGPPQIKPKPLHNPCLESKERQALHRELISNYKLGKDVLQKPELNKVLRERRETQRKKEWEEQKSSKGRSSLEVKLEERRIKEEEETKLKVIEEDESSAPELLRIHKKITHKTSGEKS